MRFVVADDGLPPRKYIVGILARAGFAVVGEARNGREAIDLCALHRPDGVILDISMPGTTGLEAAREILRSHTARHIFVASSLRMDAVADQVAALGIPFIRKPYREKQALEAILPVMRGICDA